MDFDDYETLPTNDVATHMTAGAVAGVMEHCVMYPLDSVKTRMQNLSPTPNATYRGISETLFRMVKHEGVLRPVRGMSAVVMGAGPAHALYFSSYEYVKKSLTQALPFNSHVAVGTAGVAATLLHDGVMNPAEVVKQRLQMYNSPYKSCLDCMVKVYHAEGLRAFYRSYTTQLTMNIPFQSIHFIIYEFAQSLTNPERHYNPKAHMLSGACAGGVAAAVTTPLDVCKTLLNTQPVAVRESGLFHAIRTVYKLGGLKGYFRGIQARVLYQMPSTAICWSMYEFFKYLLSNPSTDQLMTVMSQPSDSPEMALVEKQVPSGSIAGVERWACGATSSVSGAGVYGAYSFNTVHGSDTSLPKGSSYLEIVHS
ncbi:mitoferrin-1 [Schistocerca cancellata]|uniref:mitoferrin-1 n=1 Tax=Schistocerca cancellata TaxID=274614 RepID=UPI0021190AA4|nr:mitoferrin-1 [Schistocerca cancellata]